MRIPYIKKYIKWGKEDLVKVTFAIIELLLKKGAKGKCRNEKVDTVALQTLFKKYQGNETTYNKPALQMPNFEAFANTLNSEQLITLWNNTSQKSKVLHAIKYLEDATYLNAQRSSFISITDKAYKHIAWEHGYEDKIAIDILTNYAKQLQPKENKLFLNLLKKISTHLKPCYDYSIYENLYAYTLK